MTEFEFTRLVGKYRANVYRLALCYTKNRADADDVTQDAFLKLYEKQPSIATDEETKAWLLRTAANRCKDLLKTHWYKFSEPLNEEMRAPDTIYDEGSELLTALSKLPPKTRTVLYMYYYEEYSVKEIAELIGDTETAVTSQLWRGRNRLKTLLKNDDAEKGSELYDGIQ